MEGKTNRVVSSAVLKQGGETGPERHVILKLPVPQESKLKRVSIGSLQPKKGEEIKGV